MSFHVEHLNQASRHCLTFIRLLLHLAHEGVHNGEDEEAGRRNPHKTTQVFMFVVHVAINLENNGNGCKNNGRGARRRMVF